VNVLESSSIIEPAQDSRPSTIPLLLTFVRYLKERTTQKITCTIARQAMNRLRKDPARLTRTLRSARQVMFVCHGNIIRSAFAAHLLQQQLGVTGRVRVTSAGLEATPGRAAHPMAHRLATRLHIDLSHHAASRLSRQDVRASDVVFVVDAPQFAALRARFPEARDKVFPLTCLAPKTPLEVEDPINGDDRAFHVCFAHIIRALDPIRRVIAGSDTNR